MPRPGVLRNTALHNKPVVRPRNIRADTEANQPPENPMRMMPDGERMECSTGNASNVIPQIFVAVRSLISRRSLMG